MTIKDRFLKQWRKNFEEFTPPELQILKLSIPEVDDTSASNNEDLPQEKLDALQVDLEHTHDLIFKIRNELKRAKFCQSWLQREHTRCRKHSESMGGMTTTPDPSGSDLDDVDEPESPLTLEDQGDDAAGAEAEDEESPQDEIGEDDEDEPLYMNLGEGEDVIGEESDSDHDYEYLYDNTPFSHNRMPPPPLTLNGSPDSPIEPPRSPSPSQDLDNPDFNMSRSYSIDKPDMTTSDRLKKPTLALPAGIDTHLPSSLIAEAQKKRLSANFANLSPVDMDSGAFSMDSSVSPSVSSSDDKDSTSPEYGDIRRASDITLEINNIRPIKPVPPTRSNSLPGSKEPPALIPRRHAKMFDRPLSEMMENEMSTPEREELNIRRLVLNGILESEKKYIKCMEELLKMMKVIKLNVHTSQPTLTMEDYDIIFFRIPELCEIHRRFCNHMEPKLQNWTMDETYGDSFKLLISNFSVHEEYVANYKRCLEAFQRNRQENEKFKDFAEQTIKSPSGENLSLETMLHSPLQRITKLTMALHDLLNRTPQSHEDYGILYQVLEKTKKFMDQVDIATKDVNPNTKQKRHIVKQDYLVESHQGERKLRYVILYSDLIVCAKEKPASGVFASKGQYECVWYMPITELSLTPNEHSESEQKITHKSDAELDDLKKEISDLKAAIRRDTDPRMGPSSSPPLLRSSRRNSKQNKQIQKNVTINKKKLAELEAMLILESPKLSFHIYHHQGKTYTLLMSSDYERSEWKESILSTKRECRITPNLTPYHIEKLMGKIRRGDINKIGSVLIKDDSQLLFGQLHITVHKAQGLKVPSQLYCCIEVDAYGIFFLRAKTKTSQNSNMPTWEQMFDFEVDGAQKLRILVYDYTKGLDDEMYDKGAITLERSKLGSQTEKIPLQMGRIQLEVSIRFQRQDKVLKRVMSRKKQGVFGVRLAQLTHREGTKIPHIIMQCVDEVERRGMEEMGIYRISGSSGDINNLKKTFETHQKNKLSRLIKTVDIHALAGLLKLFFRELPEPLFTAGLYNKFVDGFGLRDPEAKHDCMMSLLKSVPDVNRHTIFHIFNHLRRVASHAGQNKMSLHNLSTVFGPTLIGPAVTHDKGKGDALANILGMSDVISQVGILHYYLEHFAGDGRKPQRIERQVMNTDL